MRLRTFLSTPLLLLGALLFASCSSSPPINFGDMSPGNLWFQAGARQGAGDLDQALIYANKLIELHSAEAMKEQASLSDYPSVKDAYSYPALNAVAGAYMIKGEVLTNKGDKAGARDAYNTVISNFGYAQFQDVGNPEDWLKASEVAEQRLKAL